MITVARSLSDLWYRLKVTATDSGSLTTSTFLDIFVDDDDDVNVLRLTRSIYHGALSTDTLPGRLVSIYQNIVVSVAIYYISISVVYYIIY